MSSFKACRSISVFCLKSIDSVISLDALVNKVMITLCVANGQIRNLNNGWCCFFVYFSCQNSIFLLYDLHIQEWQFVLCLCFIYLVTCRRLNDIIIYRNIKFQLLFLSLIKDLTAVQILKCQKSINNDFKDHKKLLKSIVYKVNF